MNISTINETHTIEIIEIKIDSEARGYSPFSILTVVLIIGIAIIFMIATSKPINGWLFSNYWKLFFGTILLEFILLQIVFPNEKIELTIGEDNKLTFQYEENKKKEK